MSESEIVLHIDRGTAEAVVAYLYQVGEHLAAGASLEPLRDDAQVEMVGAFLSKLSKALGGPERLA